MQIGSSYDILNPYGLAQAHSDQNLQASDRAADEQSGEVNETAQGKNSTEARGSDEQKESESPTAQAANGEELSEADLSTVRRLQAADREVRAHEAAHQAAGGGLAGAASFSYTRGPDNKMYATAGEVPITIKEGATPEETIAIAQQIKAAAMAPANPSGQDYRVAASASRLESQARAEAAELRAKETNKENENDSNLNEEDGAKDVGEGLRDLFADGADEPNLNAVASKRAFGDDDIPRATINPKKDDGDLFSNLIKEAK